MKRAISGILSGKIDAQVKNSRLYKEIINNKRNDEFYLISGGYINEKLYKFYKKNAGFIFIFIGPAVNPFMLTFLWFIYEVKANEYKDDVVEDGSFHDIICKDPKLNVFEYMRRNMSKEDMINFNNYIISECY